MKRRDMKSHNLACMEQHLDSAVDKLEKALKRIEILEDKGLKSEYGARVMYGTHYYSHVHCDDKY